MFIGHLGLLFQWKLFLSLFCYRVVFFILLISSYIWMLSPCQLFVLRTYSPSLSFAFSISLWLFQMNLTPDFSVVYFVNHFLFCLTFLCCVFKKKYFICLQRVLVAACRNFICGVWTVSCRCGNPVPWVKPGTPALGAPSLGHRTKTAGRSLCCV